MANRIRERIAQGQLAIGTYVNLADPAVVEMIGIAGYDAAKTLFQFFPWKGQR